MKKQKYGSKLKQVYLVIKDTLNDLWHFHYNLFNSKSKLFDMFFLKVCQIMQIKACVFKCVWDLPFLIQLCFY